VNKTFYRFIIISLFCNSFLLAQEERKGRFLVSTNEAISLEVMDFGAASISAGQSDSLTGFKICAASMPYMCLVSDSPDYNFAFPRNFAGQSSWVFAGYTFEVNGMVERDEEIIYSISSASIEPKYLYVGSTDRLAPYNYKADIFYSTVNGILSIKKMVEFDGKNREPVFITFLDGGLNLDSLENFTPDPWLLDYDQVLRLFDESFKRDTDLIDILKWRN
jgi:hypothetical protein